MRISVVIPTINGREDYLERCITGYAERHKTDHAIQFHVIRERWSGGIAWQEGATRAQEEGSDFIHLTNDDIVPGWGYLQPMIDSVARGEVPVVGIVIPGAEILDALKMPLAGNPTTINSSHFEGHPVLQPAGRVAVGPSEYPSLPFCSMQQWESIGPMIPSHYGTDKWFGHRAHGAGFPSVCVDALFYHYAAFAGRDERIDGWLGQDRLSFDHNVAYPMYVSGALDLTSLHPDAKTLTGRDMARHWYATHVGQTYWED